MHNSSSIPHVHGENSDLASGGINMDRGMGTRQSVVTFAELPSVIDIPRLRPHDTQSSEDGYNANAAPGAHLHPQDDNFYPTRAMNPHFLSAEQGPPSSHESDALRPVSLLSAASASSALSELSESLRWAQKFPEGKHLSRARLSVVSMSNKEKSASGSDEVEIVPTLGYGGSAGSDGSRRNSSRLSALNLNGLLRAPRSWRSEEENQTLNETRSGLRFLAKRREEVEEADYDVHATFGASPSLAHNIGSRGDHGGRHLDHDDDADSWQDDMGGPKHYVTSAATHVQPPSTHDIPSLGELPDSSEPPPRKAKWNTFKIVLFISMLIIFAYGTSGLVASLLTWSRSWGHADVTVVADTDILIFITLASFLCVLTSVVGLCGAILNNRPILALYSFLLWPTFMSMMVVGYTSYKRANLRLDRKLNMAWSRYYTDLDRLRLQNNLHCCGFYSPLHEATFSRTCYPRTNLPGCKGKLFRYERAALRTMYHVAFTLIFIHLGAIAASLLCSNHVNEQFGKGLTPRAYRLDMSHVRKNAVNIMRALIESGPETGGEKKAGLDEEDEKRSWDGTDDTPVNSYHGHGPKPAEMVHTGDLGYEHGAAPGHQNLFTPYSFPPRTELPPPRADHAPAVYSISSPTTADVGTTGIRVVSYSAGDDGSDLREMGMRGPPPGLGSVRGLGFTVAVPPHEAVSLRDRKLGEYV
ncbi:hypothetical protein OC846_004487 [Tilletia horrida]|uniref:Tetraspanin Tsp2 n=1 Tax=Tilletia horrida TaxID=155126 RepID=A0AAN6GMI5_9BASI|nr:hypothetical protein OC845_005314 [Tilletia horrida]KAK0548414.1 hypothetical protein OC846_004487 [Tilletia horrida]KAK0563683.1 hypothetical protein OC861_004678 [Tilletia horrida]